MLRDHTPTFTIADENLDWDVDYWRPLDEPAESEEPVDVPGDDASPARTAPRAAARAAHGLRRHAAFSTLLARARGVKLPTIATSRRSSRVLAPAALTAVALALAVVVLGRGGSPSTPARQVAAGPAPSTTTPATPRRPARAPRVVPSTPAEAPRATTHPRAARPKAHPPRTSRPGRAKAGRRSGRKFRRSAPPVPAPTRAPNPAPAATARPAPAPAATVEPAPAAPRPAPAHRRPDAASVEFGFES
jgi:DamX protein